MDARKYIDEIIPANYFITKSMELTRINTSGTLWFTKKFLVYYYYIFLSDSIQYSGYVTDICNIFDNYIASLPEIVQADARNFFYSTVDVADLKSPNFKLFKQFAGVRDFIDQRDEKQYYGLAKKYYFAFLMETGGQSGVNAAIRNALYTPEFCFSQLEDIINHFFGDSDFDMVRVKNDYMASLRNERQILYYYGFFHSKSNGANDEEFSSLTPIGELALNSNFYEFIAIWEHQKVKMVSQPVTVQIDSSFLRGKTYDYSLFAVNQDPYLTILYWLQNTGGFSMEEYQYLVSRVKSPITNHQDISDLQAELDYSKRHITAFNRTRETKDEDFRKELLKYLLGLRSDLAKDSDTNPLSVCRMNGGCVEVINNELLETITAVYSRLASYKKKKSQALLDSCEDELKRQYRFREEGSVYDIDPKVKIDWDLFNIHVDIPIIMTCMMLICSAVEDIQFYDEDQIRIADAMGRLMPNVVKHCGYRNRSSRVKEIARLFSAIKNDDFSSYMATEEPDYAPAQKQYRLSSNADLWAKLLTESSMESEYKDGRRERKHTLVGILRAYNENVFSIDGKLVCECCGNTTFLTAANETYLEYHHLIPFSSEGPDHYLNLYALCPMCHRKLHYLPLSEKGVLYQHLSNNNYLHKAIIDRLVELKHERQLKSYHLDFLLAENAITNADYNFVAAS